MECIANVCCLLIGPWEVDERERMPEIALRKAFQAFLFFSPRCTRLNKVFLLG